MNLFDEDLCRFCGNCTPKGKCLFDPMYSDLLAKIRTCFSTVIYKDDPLPHSICDKCERMVEQQFNRIEKFRQLEIGWLKTVASHESNHPYLQVLDLVEDYTKQLNELIHKYDSSISIHPQIIYPRSEIPIAEQIKPVDKTVLERMLLSDNIYKVKTLQRFCLDYINKNGPELLETVLATTSTVTNGECRKIVDDNSESHSTVDYSSEEEPVGRRMSSRLSNKIYGTENSVLNGRRKSYRKKPDDTVDTSSKNSTPTQDEGSMKTKMIQKYRMAGRKKSRKRRTDREFIRNITKKKRHVNDRSKLFGDLLIKSEIITDNDPVNEPQKPTEPEILIKPQRQSIIVGPASVKRKMREEFLRQSTGRNDKMLDVEFKPIIDKDFIKLSDDVIVKRKLMLKNEINITRIKPSPDRKFIELVSNKRELISPIINQKTKLPAGISITPIPKRMVNSATELITNNKCSLTDIQKSVKLALGSNPEKVFSFNSSVSIQLKTLKSPKEELQADDELTAGSTLSKSIVHSSGPARCKYCKDVFFNVKELAIHQLTHLKIETHKVGEPQILAPNLRRGRVVPLGTEKCFRCLNCWRLYPNSQAILEHWVTKKCLFYCSICGEPFYRNPKEIRDHFIAVHGIRYRMSEVQFGRTRPPPDMMAHQPRHPMMRRPIPIDDKFLHMIRTKADPTKVRILKSGRVTCEICACSFPNMQSRNSHMRLHKKDAIISKVGPNGIPLRIRSLPHTGNPIMIRPNSNAHPTAYHPMKRILAPHQMSQMMRTSLQQQMQQRFRMRPPMVRPKPHPISEPLITEPLVQIKTEQPEDEEESILPTLPEFTESDFGMTDDCGSIDYSELQPPETDDKLVKIKSEPGTESSPSPGPRLQVKRLHELQDPGYRPVRPRPTATATSGFNQQMQTQQKSAKPIFQQQSRPQPPQSQQQQHFDHKLYEHRQQSQMQHHQQHMNAQQQQQHQIAQQSHHQSSTLNPQQPSSIHNQQQQQQHQQQQYQLSPISINFHQPTVQPTGQQLQATSPSLIAAGSPAAQPAAISLHQLQQHHQQSHQLANQQQYLLQSPPPFQLPQTQALGAQHVQNTQYYNPVFVVQQQQQTEIYQPMAPQYGANINYSHYYS